MALYPTPLTGFLTSAREEIDPITFSFVLLVNRKGHFKIRIHYYFCQLGIFFFLFKCAVKFHQAFDIKKYTQNKEVPIHSTIINFVFSVYKD